MTRSALRRLGAGLKWFARAVGWTAAGLAAALGILLLAVQWDPVGRAVLVHGSRLAAPAGVELDATGVSGSWIRGLRVVGLQVRLPATGDSLAVDTLMVRWRPWTWRRDRLRVDALVAAGVAGGFTIPAPDTAAGDDSPTPSSAPAPGGGITLEVGEAALRRGQLILGRPGADPFRLGALDLALWDGRLGAETEVARAGLQAWFSPAGTDAEWGRIRLAGSLSPHGVVLDTVSVRSGRSLVAGSGRIPLADPRSYAGELRLSLTASPLVLSDLQGLLPVPAVLEGDSVDLSLLATPEADSVEVELQARSSGGARIRASGRMGSQGDAWGARFEADFGGIDLRRYTGSDRVAAPLAGRVRASLQAGGPSREGGLRAVGTATVSAPDAALEGSWEFRRRRPRDPSHGARGPLDSLEVRLDSLRIAPVALRWASITATRAEGVLRLDAELRPMEGGAARGSGEWVAGGEEEGPRFAARLTLDSVAEPRWEARVSGTASVEGQGLTLPGARASARLALYDSHWGPWAVDAARARLDWDRGSGSLEGEVRGPLGSAAWEITGQVADQGGRLAIAGLTLDSLSVPAGEGQGARMAVSGRISGDVSWDGPPGDAVSPAALTADLTFQDAGSTYGPVSTDTATVLLAWSRGRIDVDADARLPDSASVRVVGGGEVLDSVRLEVRESSFRGFDLAGLAPSLPSTALTGRLEGWLAGRPAPPAAPPGSAEPAAFPWAGDVALSLDRSPVGLDTLRTLRAHLEFAPDTLRGTVDAELGGGTVQARVSGAPWAHGGWTGDAEIRLPHLGGLVGMPDTALSLAGRVEGGRARGAPDTRISLAVDSATGWGARVDTMVASGRVTAAGVAVDTLLLRSNVLELWGGGALPARALWRGPGIGDTVPVTDSTRWRLGLEGRIPDSPGTVRLGGGRYLVAQQGSLSVAAECGPGECDVVGELTLGSVLVDRYSLASARVTLTGALEPGPRLSRGEVRGEIEGIQTPSARVRSLEADAVLADGTLDVDASTVIDQRRDADLSLTVDPRPDMGRVTLRDLRFRMDQDQWRLTRPAALRYGGPGLVLDTLEVAAGDQRVVASGTWAGPGGHDFTLRLDSMRVGTLADLAGAPGLDGWVDATVDGYGGEPAPNLEADARAGLSYRERALHRIRVQLDRGPGFLAVDAQVRDSLDRSRLRVAGEIPLAEAPDDAPGWSLRVTADSLPLRWVEPYLPEGAARGIAGAATADLDVAGGLRAPTAHGRLTLTEGRVTVPAAGITATEIRLAARADGGTLHLDTLRATSSGSALIRGSLVFSSLDEPVAADLALDLDEFLAVNTALARAVVNARGELTGTVRAPRLSGEVEVVEADIRLDEGLGGPDVEDVTLTPQDWAMVQTNFGIPPPREAAGRASGPTTAELDLAVTLGRDIWLRQQVNPELAVQFTGDFTVTRPPDDPELQLRGEVEAIPQRSYLEQFGRRFNLEEGVVRLRGSPDQTRVELTSVYQVPPRDGGDAEVSIRLHLQGEVGNMNLTLSSQPTMANSDIVSYLATGRPAASAFSGEGGSGEGSLTDVGTELVASQLTSLVERFAMQGAGLDVVEIEQTGLEGATLVAGRYVTPELFLGFRQPVSFGQSETGVSRAGETEAEVEWRALRWLLLNLETGGSAFRFFLEASLGY